MPKKPRSSMYDLLVAEAQRLGWPRLFQTDLTVHDRRLLSQRNPLQGGEFVWVVREHGTHLYFLEPAASRRVSDWELGLMRYHQQHERCHWYIGDIARRTLTPTTAEAAIRRYQAAQSPGPAAAPAMTWPPDWAGLLGAPAG